MSHYSHQFIEPHSHQLPVGKVVCVGRNYACHAKEMNSPVPEEPILFIKPNTALQSFEDAIILPADAPDDLHYETEIAILVGKPLTHATVEDAHNAIEGIGLALDLTKRNLQRKLKEKGLPWEKSKAFDNSCPLSPFMPFTHTTNLLDIHFTLQINHQTKQHGHSKDMLFSVSYLMSYISQHFTLLPGDVVLTGTPEGVGALKAGDSIVASLSSTLRLKTNVCSHATA